MSHLHLVDGIIHPIWWIMGYILALGILILSAARIKKGEVSQKVPFIGVISALMLITMSIPLGVIPFHLNLTVLVGIIGGPWLGFIAVFIVNFIMALIGHGGITVVGLNTLIIGSEVIIGHYIFKIFIKKIKPTTAAAVTVIFTLLISTSFMVGMIAATNAGIEKALPHNHEVDEHDHQDELHEHEIEEYAHYENEEFGERLEEVKLLALSGWSALAIILLLGIGLEALITLLIVRFFLKVRPDIIGLSKGQ